LGADAPGVVGPIRCLGTVDPRQLKTQPERCCVRTLEEGASTKCQRALTRASLAASQGFSSSLACSLRGGRSCEQGHLAWALQHHVARAAARLVALRGAYQHRGVIEVRGPSLDQTLRARGRQTATADG